MKQLLFSLLIFTTLGCKVLSQKPQENTTYTDNHLNKFEGSWLWVSGADTVQIKLKKQTTKITGFNNSYWQDLIGCHKYVQNGALVESNLKQYDSLQHYGTVPNIGSIRVYRFEDNDTSQVKGGLKDISKNKQVKIDLTYLGGNPVQIRMKLSNKAGAKLSLPGKPYISGITLPTDIILYKE